MGEFMDEKQKAWVKNNLKKDIICIMSDGAAQRVEIEKPNSHKLKETLLC
jgi:hypothetical protein